MNQIREKLKDYAKDQKLNLEAVLSEEGAPGLSIVQLWGVALASAYFTKNPELVSAIASESAPHLNAQTLEAAKAAATVMAMNNIYYRFLHLSEDKEYGKMPAKLRMNILARPVIPKVDFELMALAVSALSGCGLCINSHVAEVKKAGVTNEGVQSTVRIAAVLNATAQALSIN